MLSRRTGIMIYMLLGVSIPPLLHMWLHSAMLIY